MRRKLLCIGALVAASGLAEAAGNGKFSSQTVLGVPCSEIFERGIDKQENLRAGLIRIGCGLDAPGQPGAEVDEIESVDVANINVITGPEVFPHVTQSESYVDSTPDGMRIVINYNDSRDAPSNFSGVSYSIDGGATFSRILPSPFVAGHGTNFGDPIVVFNVRLNRWFAGDLATGCGGQGIGLWTSNDGITWTVGACAHSGTNDDRESMWIDRNPASPFYGRMYISWNDFAAGQRIFVTRSDDGIIWSAPVPVTTGFIRNIQLTGSPDDGGTVFVAGMDEGGGGVNPRVNWIYRSMDGGISWTPIQQGPPFAPPGQALCGYFAAIPPIWRHMGWGQPAVGPGGVVHYAYAGHGQGTDLGDIFYTRSADNGTTWSVPIVLNTDSLSGGRQAQWMPSVSATPEGIVEVTWYDRRNTSPPSNTSYELWSRASRDNGITWDLDQPISDVVSPQPEQPDPNVQGCYAGDYNYQNSISGKTWVTWTDGRNAINGHFQQDVYFAGTNQALSGGTIEGTITDMGTGTPIAGARVRAVGPVDRSGTSDPTGFYRIRLPSGSYDMTVSAFGYSPGTASGVMVVDGQATTQNFALTPGPAHRVSGTVTSSGTGLPIAGATVTILGTPIPPATTDMNGMYLFSSVPEGTYDMQASASGFASRTMTGVVVNADVVVDFALDPRVGPCAPDRIDAPGLCSAVPGNLVLNCGFETGDFTSWVRSGDPGYTTVDAASAHSGSFGLDTGPVNGLGFVAQMLPTTPGATYNLRFWLRNLGGTPNRVTVSWGGTPIFDSPDLPVFDYTQYCWSGSAPSASTELKFGFQQAPSYFYFDDVSVAP